MLANRILVSAMPVLVLRASSPWHDAPHRDESGRSEKIERIGWHARSGGTLAFGSGGTLGGFAMGVGSHSIRHDQIIERGFPCEVPRLP